MDVFRDEGAETGEGGGLFSAENGAPGESVKAV